MKKKPRLPNLTDTRRVGVLGWMFDPIHIGHIAAGTSAQAALRLDQVVLVPSSWPPHRSAQPEAGPDDRLQMARIVAQSQKTWDVSVTEITRVGKSYTFDTLTALQERGQTPDKIGQLPESFFFILGADAFAEIESWSRYPQVLDLAHFVVISRPGNALAELGNKLPSLSARMTTPDAFLAGPKRETTSIILIEATTPLVSSTLIRRRVARGESIFGLVPAEIDAYIRERHLYAVAREGPPLAGR